MYFRGIFSLYMALAGLFRLNLFMDVHPADMLKFQDLFVKSGQLSDLECEKPKLSSGAGITLKFSARRQHQCQRQEQS